MTWHKHWQGPLVRRSAAKGVRRFLALVTGFVLLSAVWAGGGAAAVAAARGLEVDVAGEWSGTFFYRDVDGVAQTWGVLGGRLNLGLYPAVSSRWHAAVAVEPWFPLDLGGAGQALPGSVVVTAAYAGWRFPTADVYAGRFPLPLETARLTLPFTVTSYDEAGRRPGVDGVRTDVYLPAGRLQLAVLRLDEAWSPLVGWRQQLAGWEALGHLLWGNDGPAAGVGASGLIGSTVVYGELWTLAGEQGLRASVGATGFLGDLLWTAELARAPFPPPGAQGLSSLPVSLGATQVTYALAPGWTVVADASIVLDDEVPGGHGSPLQQERAHEWGVTFTYDLLPGQAELELSVRRQVRPPGPAALGAVVALRGFF